MSPRIALLLCALLLVACGAPTVSAAPTWQLDEIAYLNAVEEPLQKFLEDISLGGPEDIADANNRLLHLGRTPNAPATLAVIELQRERVTRLCWADKPTDECLSAIDALRLELARLYAARGSYPPTATP